MIVLNVDFLKWHGYTESVQFWFYENQDHLIASAIARAIEALGLMKCLEP